MLPAKNLEISNNRKFTRLKMNNTTVRFQLDTSNDITIIDEKLGTELATLTLQKPTKLQEEYRAKNKFFLWKLRVTSLLRLKLKKQYVLKKFQVELTRHRLARIIWIMELTIPSFWGKINCWSEKKD